MNVLLVGGTRFVGRHITAALLARGHAVTHFNRGRTQSGYGGVASVHGDRARDLERLQDRQWDAVVDTCGYTPAVVEISARYFANRAARYVFISTISVYDETKTDGPDEQAPLRTLPAGADMQTFTAETYGALKALCERVVEQTFAQRALVLRPGLIAGRDDPTDRFTYWPLRIAAGGDVLAPVSPEQPLQYIDARDLAQFAAATIEAQANGTYNCVTPADSHRFGELLDACGAQDTSAANVIWADAPFLQRHGVEPWSDLPLWVPEGTPDSALVNVRSERARAAGLQSRSLNETAGDVLSWARESGRRWGSLSAGLQPAREAQLLAAYRAEAKSPSPAQ